MSTRSIVVDRELSQFTHHGINTINLIEKITRERVFDSLYWKQYCFNLNCANFLDETIKIKCIGNLSNNGRPFPFICLLIKLIQLMPNFEIIEFYIIQKKFKYLKILALFYTRIIFKNFKRLSLELNDYRKVRIYENGELKLSFIDEIVDRLINDDMIIGLNLPYMKRGGGESDSDDDSDSESDNSNSDDDINDQ